MERYSIGDMVVAVEDIYQEYCGENPEGKKYLVAPKGMIGRVVSLKLSGDIEFL